MKKITNFWMDIGYNISCPAQPIPFMQRQVTLTSQVLTIPAEKCLVHNFNPFLFKQVFQIFS